jgi:heme exporter protein C
MALLPSPAMTRTGRPIVYWILFALGALMTMFAFYWAFFYAPLEATMGVVQKIFYIHVPVAIAMQVLFIVCGIASLVYLVNPGRRVDQLAVAAAEVGVVMGIFALITGPLWARKAWGHYWEWEPRLTLTLVLAFLFAAYTALRSFGGTDDLTRRIAAGVAIAGIPAIYLVRKAVEWWRGTHPSVIYKKDGLADPDMKIAFYVGALGVACMAAVFVWERYMLEDARNEVDELVLQFMERDLLEEDV